MTDRSFSDARLTCEDTAEALHAFLINVNKGGREARRRMAGDMIRLLEDLRLTLAAAAEELTRAEEMEQEIARLRRRLETETPDDPDFLNTDDDSLLKG